MTRTSVELPQTGGACSVPNHQHLSARVAELENRVMIDALTGLWNRAHFDRVFNQELDRSLRHRQPLSLILFDIDYFKRVNDTHGHQTGDAVLRELARIGTAASRKTDALFRWGGEEFALLAPSTGYRGAGRLAETLRTEVAGHAFAHGEAITISLGVAEYQSHEAAQNWFRRADDALYTAKRNGRNAVHVDARGNSDAWAQTDGVSALHLVWQEAYECGEPTIDAEHRMLFDLANVLIRLYLNRDSSKADIIQAYDELLAHIRLHFKHEEALLEAHGYHNAAGRKRVHDALLQRADTLRGVMAQGDASLGGIIEFLAGDVVARHLFKADREFFSLFSTARKPS